MLFRSSVANDACSTGHVTVNGKEGKPGTDVRVGDVLGLRFGDKYSEYEIQLEPGAKLFVCTDGVPEAKNASNEMFGTERMIHALNVCLDVEPMDVMKNIRGAVDGFVLDAEQFDDVPMLRLEYKGREPSIKKDV